MGYFSSTELPANQMIESLYIHFYLIIALSLVIDAILTTRDEPTVVQLKKPGCGHRIRKKTVRGAVWRLVIIAVVLQAEFMAVSRSLLLSIPDDENHC